jgi:hypothetical protein
MLAEKTAKMLLAETTLWTTVRPATTGTTTTSTLATTHVFADKGTSLKTRPALTPMSALKIFPTAI